MRAGLSSALFTTTQRRLLSLLFGQPARAFGKNELIQLSGGGSGAVQREVQRLVESGLVTERALDRRKQVQANPSSPIFAELCSIIDKTSGIAVQLRAVLEPLAPRLRLALLFGSVAKGSDRADSDVDLLVVSDALQLEDLYRATAPLELRLGRRISPTLYTCREFTERRDKNNPFLAKVLSGQNEALFGEIDGIEGA